MPNGITAEPLDFTKDTAELKFTLNGGGRAHGKFESLMVDTVISNDKGEIIHRSGTGALKVYEPLPPALQAATPPPAEPRPDEPERKTRFPAT